MQVRCIGRVSKRLKEIEMPHRNLRQQQGLGMLSGILVIGVALFFGMIGLKIVPVYLEAYSVRSVLESMADDSTLRDKGIRELQQIFHKRLKINGVYSFKADAFKLTKDKNVLRASTDYQVIEPVIGNVSILMTFKDEVEIPR